MIMQLVFPLNTFYLKLDVIDGVNPLEALYKCHDPIDFMHSHLSTDWSTGKQISYGRPNFNNAQL